MSTWAAFWVVVAIAVVGGAVVLALIWVMVAAERRREALTVAALRDDLRVWAERDGWVAADPPPELTGGGLDTVLAGEQRRIVLAGTHAGHPAALIWCTWSHDEVTWRYLTLLVGLAHPVPELVVRHRRGLSLRRRNPEGADDARFGQLFAVGPGAVPASGPLHRALLDLRSVAGPSDQDEFVRVAGRVLRVVVNTWPGPHTVNAVLGAVAGTVAALPASPVDGLPPAER